MTAIVVTPARPPRRRLPRRADADEPWSTLTRLDPIYYLVDVARSVITGFLQISRQQPLGLGFESTIKRHP